MRNHVCSIVCFLLCCSYASAQRLAKPDLSGTWQLIPGKSEIPSGEVTGATWIIEAKDGAIHLRQTAAGKGNRQTEWLCPTNGKDCDVAAGEKAKGSFWYNGALLVELETRGEKTTRYRMKMSEDGKVLNVDVTYIVPPSDKQDKLYFEKQP